MKIAFFAPIGAVSGGIRIILEIANGLSAKGHEVYLVSDEKGVETMIPIKGPKTVFEEDLADIGQLDLAIATLWNSVWSVQRCNTKKRGYMVQHDERISWEPKIVEPTYRIKWDFCITIAPWLKRMMEGFGQENVYLLSPATDKEVFKPYGNKLPDRIIYFSRGLIRKNPSLGFAALEHIKNVRPDIEIVTFDSSPLPAAFEFVDQHIQNPSQEELGKLYSSATVYMQSAPIEGYGLLAIEALSCGTAVVTPDVAGPEVFAFDEKGPIIRFAELTKEDISKQCLRLIDNPEERRDLEERGLKAASQITWPDEVEKLERFIGGQSGL